MRFSNSRVSLPVFQIPDEESDAAWLQSPSNLSDRGIVVRAPVPGLCHDYRVRPCCGGPGVLERARPRSHSGVVHGLDQDVAEPFGGLNGVQLFDVVLPVGKQRTREDARALAVFSVYAAARKRDAQLLAWDHHQIVSIESEVAD